MEVAVADDTVFNEILSAEDVEQIPEIVCKKLQHACVEKFNELITVKALLQTQRNNFDEKYSTLENKLEGINQEYEESKTKLDLVENFKTDLQNKYDEARKKISHLENTVLRLEKDNVEFKRQRDLFSEERDTFQSQVERKNTELELSRTEIASLSDQLQAAIATKCNALQDIAEVKSREMTLDFKEKRLEQKEKLMNQQNASLKEQIANLTSELQTICSDAVSRNLLKETRLVQLEEELRISVESAGRYRDAQAILQQRCDGLAQKVEEQRNQEIAMHASYREEIAAQMKLAELYKDLAAEANKKEQDFKDAINELQNLVQKATDEYGILETKYSDETENLREDIEERDAKIKELTDELNHANELLQNFKQEKMEQAIVHLAPSAVVTNRILKKGLGLTEMYNQLVECTNESDMIKAENEHLKNEMNKINFAMEENVPLLQQKLQEYATAMDNIKTLKTQMDELVLENLSLQDTVKEARRKADFHGNQNDKSKTEISYLARQVCVLLQEIQKLQTGCLVHENDCSMTIDSDEFVSSKVISKRLVTFRDIEELQEKNQQLLSVVRTLADNKEEVESLAEEFNTGALKERIQGYIDKIEQLQADRERVDETLEQICEEFDTYKRMVESRDVNETDEDESSGACENNFDGDNEKSKRFKNFEKNLADSETKVKQLTEELEANKQEKDVEIKMLNDNMKKLQKEAEKSSAKCCKLKVQLDTANEQFHLLQANVAYYKTQIKALEEKCCNYNATIDKHEHSLSVLHNDLMNAKSQASQTGVQLENLKHDHQLLQASEVRLIQEIEVLQRERQVQALLKADVESIKTSLERVQSENVLRIEQRVDNTNRECSALRRRLQEEQDRFRGITIKLEKQTNEAQERLLKEKHIANKTTAELEAMKRLEMQHLERIDELAMKLKEMETNFMMKPSSSRIKELELELANHQAEIKALSIQLKSTQQQSKQYFNLAEESKVTVRELTDQYDKVKEEQEQALRQSQEQIIILQKKVEDLEAEIAKAHSEQQESCELRERLTQSEKKLEELDELKNQIEILKSDLKTSVDALAEAEDKYAKEMMSHSGDVQTLAKIKEDNSAVSRQIEVSTQEQDSAVTASEIEKSTMDDREAHNEKEIEETNQRLDNLNKQNSLLHDQIQELSDKLVVALSQQGHVSGLEPSEEGMNISFTDDSKSVEQLMQVLKLLRREKDLAVSKFDIIKAENLQLKSQIEIIEGRLKETEGQLNSNRLETLDAMTDSNRTLREERDALNQQVKELSEKLQVLTTEMDSLNEKAVGMELLAKENDNLRKEATKLQQQVDTMIECEKTCASLQSENENLSKVLTTERELHVKQTEKLSALETEKTKVEEQLMQLQKQFQAEANQITSLSEESKRLSRKLLETLSNAKAKDTELAELKKKLEENEAILNDVRSRELQNKEVADKCETQGEEIVGTLFTQEKQDDLKEAGRSEMRNENNELSSKLAESKLSIEAMQTENNKLKKEIKDARDKFLKNEEKSKQILRTARHKIESMHEVKTNHEKEIAGLKEKIESETSTLAETQAKLVALKSDMEGKIEKLEREKSELLAEKKALAQRIEKTFLQCQQQNVSGAGASTDSPTFCIKSRAINVSPQSRTTSIYRTTTETSSPTSSHTEYQPESTSESESTQCEMESSETEQKQSYRSKSKQVQQQTVASSSTQFESTSPSSTNQKRLRNEEIEEISQDQIASPKAKRSRHQEVSDSGSEVEYQVATSSQRDQDEEREQCSFVIECEEIVRGNRHVPGEKSGSHEVEMKSNDNEVELVELVDDSASSTAGPAVDDTTKISVSNINVAVEAQETAIIDLSSKKSPNTEGVSTYRINDSMEQDDDASVSTKTASEGEVSPLHNTRNRTQARATSYAASFPLTGSPTRTLTRGGRRGRPLTSRGAGSVRGTRKGPNDGTKKRGTRGRTRGRPSRKR